MTEEISEARADVAHEDFADERTADLLARRAEHDARRWEHAAVEMERQRNEATQARRKAESERDEMRFEVAREARAMIDALDKLAKEIADRFGIPLPTRGCFEDDD